MEVIHTKDDEGNTIRECIEENYKFLYELKELYEEKGWKCHLDMLDCSRGLYILTANMGMLP